MPLRCPHCATTVPEGPAPTCPTCGFAAPARPAPAQAGTDQTLAIVGLILNILILPGLGSLIGGRTQEGIWQLVLVVGGAILMFVGMLLIIILIGFVIIPLAGLAMLAGWAWGIVTGVQMVQAAQSRP